ncbi:MAG: phosphatidate cytidylyltransferase [Rhodobacteraceae bacterium]|nr:phosphatidate cytidylyltransferase [Paracoccaceae bacterium]
MSETGKFTDLTLRIISGVVLASVALVVFYTGGNGVWLLLGVAGSLMSWEYRRMMLPEVSLKDPGLWLMVAGCFAAVITTNLFNLWWAFIPLVAAAVGIWGIRHKRPIWISLGFLYIAFPMAALVYIRAEMGLATVLWLIAVVVASDVGGYFVGRQVGGPKLWPAISPKKTWSGTVGGWLLALVVGFIYALAVDGISIGILGLSFGLAMAAQAGDLAESWIKRRQGVKDASNLIPGHGGLLDRFDGLMAATTVFMILQIF